MKPSNLKTMPSDKPIQSLQEQPRMLFGDSTAAKTNIMQPKANAMPQ